MGYRKLLLCGVVAVAACVAPDSSVDESTSDAVVRACDTTQIFGNPQHTGKECAGLSSLSVIARVTVDPDAQRLNADLGFYAVHPSSALTRGPWVYVSGKRGYTDLDHKDTQTWSVTALRWVGHSLLPQWSYSGKYKPYDAVVGAFASTNGYESLFQPVLTARGLYVPDTAGRLTRLDPTTGAVMSTIDPLAGTVFAGDLRTTVNSALTAGDDGTIWYTAVAWDPVLNNSGAAPRQSWLVRIDGTTDVATATPWTSIAVAAIGVRETSDLCSYPFFFSSPRPALPWPDPAVPTPPQIACGVQRPTINAAPAVTPDGKVIVSSISTLNPTYSYLIAVDASTLVPQWSASLHGTLLDGCGINIPYSSVASTSVCRPGAPIGVDPTFNEAVSGRLSNIMESAPVVAPDGSVYVASYTSSYDNNRGHLHHVSPKGAPVGTFSFGWSSTPAIRALSSGGFELIVDDNHYSPTTGDGTGQDGVFSTVRLSSDLAMETAVVTTVNDPTAVANDFVDGQAAVDTAGSSYVFNAAGRVSKISPAGTVLASVSLGVSLETLSVEPVFGTDDAGNILLYGAFAGTLYVIGDASLRTDPPRVTPPATVRAAPQGAHRRGDAGADPAVPLERTSGTGPS